jgi:anthocyanidin reductase
MGEHGVLFHSFLFCLLSSDDDQLLEKPRVCLSSGKLVREGFQFKHNTLDEIFDDVVEYGKALGILVD